tara:strand:+ start:139 stop:357 length:219 start_codon:yes stop_codon:yes gene_type:complete
MEELLKRLDNLELKVDTILELLEKDVKPNCNKMNNHINFVENVYSTVKNPLAFICNRVNYLRNGEDQEYSLE